ncbi:3-deoxy-manno-octulosonate cytidylyltransferase [Thiomicrorhabdus sp. 6S3-12]|uniref:3-deoxy-manno-octulosonate cytidylyltransferase n=1 Tax=Thiomicrorhabdus sp. 6S3-12 TaxID=2819681 RepID=UPI001AACD8E2|nr:3-deoxy-manno-octulosonate cytidylyltransferase [Thiomicrorhabdus sp. 6S3-12]MBO1924099.1 3-deoxy-manno-octulosonate cytidylyltransferase [Thiomicrorhabdus sp. 6S3-12]
MSFVVIIPARLQSSRLPRKPLMEINGYPMVYWTWMQAKKSGASRIIIATESHEVADACHAFGAEVCITGEHHQSGTERIAEVIELSLIGDEQIIVNVQGDEPMLPPELIHQVAQGLEENPSVPMATLCEEIDSAQVLFDPNAVKVSRDANDFALTFSRAPLPWARDEFAQSKEHLPSCNLYRRHIGLYAYRAGFVKRYVAWPECELEQIEKLEQLRVLWHGEKILVLDALMDAGVGVDTEQDLQRVRQLMTSGDGA